MLPLLPRLVPCPHTLPRARLIQLPQQLLHRRHPHRVERLNFRRIHRHAHAPCLRVDAEGGFVEMVAVLGDLGIETGVGVLEDDVLEGVGQDCLGWGLVVGEMWKGAGEMRMEA